MSDIESQVKAWLNDSIDAELGPQPARPPFDPNRIPRTPTSRRPSGRHWALPLLAAACVIAVVAGTWTIVNFTSQRQERPGISAPTTSSSRTTTSATSASPPPRQSTTTGRTAKTPPVSPPASTDPASVAPWTASVLLLTPTALGAVRDGMTLTQAEQAAGISFAGAGDGARYPLLSNGPHLYLRLNGSGAFPPCRAATGDGTTTPTIVTAEGFRLGEPVTTLKALYGNRLVYVPAPSNGLAPRAGYMLTEPTGTLIFGLDPTATTITEIAGSTSATLQPSGCPG